MVFLHAQTAVFPEHRYSTLGPGSFFLFSLSHPLLLLFCISPSLSCITYQFLLLFLPLLTLLHFLPFLYYSDTSPPVPLYLDLVLRDYIPPLNFSVTELFTVFSFYLPSVFPSLIVHIIMFLGLPAHADFTMEYHWTMTLTPPPFFVIFCYLLPLVVLIFTHMFFVLLPSTSSLLSLPFTLLLLSPVYPSYARSIFTMQ